MQKTEMREQRERAAPSWALWEVTTADRMQPATESSMASVDNGARVFDLFSGAGSQRLQAARRVGEQGHVVATDIADTMLHVQENARGAGLGNVKRLLVPRKR